MMRLLFSSLVLIAACTSAPHESAPDVGDIPCVTCHMSDFQMAMGADPTHTNTDCAQCHDTSGWGGTHPESKFPITTGAHKNIACLTCHSEPGSYVGGANTNCIQCHSASQFNGIDDHRGTTYDTSMPNFCLKCHPSGRAGG